MDDRAMTALERLAAEYAECHEISKTVKGDLDRARAYFEALRIRMNEIYSNENIARAALMDYIESLPQ